MRRAVVSSAGVAFALAIALPAAADDNDLEALLEEPLVATASKSTEATSTAPAMSTIITAADLRRYGIRSLDEALNFLSTGMNAETPLTAAEVGARGVLISKDYGAHVLLLIDGHSINEVWGGTAYFERNAAIPFEIIDHIEVIVGPGSVLYGSSAMLGVINVVTKRARDYRGLHAVVESEILPGDEGAPGYSMRTGAGVGYDFDVLDTKGELTFQAEYYHLDGPPFRFGPQDYGADSITGEPRFWSDQTAPGIWGGVARDAYYAHIPTAYARFAIGDFQLKARAALTERAVPYQSAGNFDDPGNYELDRWLSLDASYRRTVGENTQLSARLYGDLYDYQQFYPSTAPEDCLEGQNNGCLYYLLGTAKWAGLELNASFDWLANARFVTLIGADARVKNVGSLIDITDLETEESGGQYGVLDQTELAMGIYAQQILRPASWLGFNAGVRVDLDQRYGAYASPRFAATVSPWKGAAFKAVYAKAFRAPTAFERYYAEPTSQIAAPDLEPEVVRGIEGSFEQRFGSHRIEFGGFQSSWRDLVVTDALSPAEIAAAIQRGELEEGVDYAEQTRNADSIEAYGYTARVDGSALSGRLTYGASVTRAHARRINAGAEEVELPASSPLIGNARIGYDIGGGWPTVAIATRFTSERGVDGTDDHGRLLKVPAQVELRGTISGPVPVLTGLSYRVSGSYAFADRFPYTAGPATLADGSAELAPVDQIKIAIQLGYDFDF